MKSLSLTAMAAFFAFAAYCCDFPTAPTVYRLSAGQTQIVQWSFADCTNSLNNFTIDITKPRFHKGTLQNLSSHTPLSIAATNLTTGEAATQAGPFVLTFTNNVQGADVVLSMFFEGYSNTNKVLSVEVSTTATN